VRTRVVTAAHSASEIRDSERAGTLAISARNSARLTSARATLCLALDLLLDSSSLPDSFLAALCLSLNASSPCPTRPSSGYWRVALLLGWDWTHRTRVDPEGLAC
jgi:hypothetical protein